MYHSVLSLASSPISFLCSSIHVLKAVIITDLGQRQKSAYNAENSIQCKKYNRSSHYRCLLYVGFHNLEPQNAGLVNVKMDLH